jgi:uncharacterized protein (UPF0332 family)
MKAALLLDKSQENYQVAEKAWNDKNYNAAVSRYYYSAFEHAKYLLINSRSFTKDSTINRDCCHDIENGNGNGPIHSLVPEYMLNMMENSDPVLVKKHETIKELTAAFDGFYLSMKVSRNTADYSHKKAVDKIEAMKMKLTCDSLIEIFEMFQ